MGGGNIDKIYVDIYNHLTIEMSPVGRCKLVWVQTPGGALPAAARILLSLHRGAKDRRKHVKIALRDEGKV